MMGKDVIAQAQSGEEREMVDVSNYEVPKVAGG